MKIFAVLILDASSRSPRVLLPGMLVKVEDSDHSNTNSVDKDDVCLTAGCVKAGKSRRA